MGSPRIPAGHTVYNEARAAFEQEAWSDAIRLASQSLVLNPLDAEAFELVTAARRSLDMADRTEGERRILSVLFCDLVGSTSLVASIGAERYREIILAIQQICVEKVTSFEGRVAQYLGDGVLAYFSYPQAHDDDPRRAVLAGLAIVESVARLSGKLDVGGPIEIRVGIDTGLVVVGAMGSGQWTTSDSIVGDPPNVAARLLALAEPSWVVVSDATLRLVEGFFRSDPLGDLALKNYPRPVTAHRVLGPTGAEHRFDAVKGRSPLVNRVDEVARLTAAWGDVVGGSGRQILLVGEPGIGKSRLLEHGANLVKAAGGRTIEIRCSGLYSQTALRPVAFALRRMLGIDDTGEPIGPDALRQRLETIAGRGPVDDELVEVLGYLAGVKPPPDLLPEDLRQRTLFAVVAYIQTVARSTKLLLVVDDVHDADASTRELLKLLAGSEMPPFMLLMAARPELSDLGFRPTVIHVEPLKSDDALDLVRTIAMDASPEEYREVVTRSDGIPIFLEELAGTLTAGVNVQQTLPIALSGALTAHLDRLESTDREVASALAVLNQESDFELLADIVDLPTSAVEGSLRKLINARVIVPDADITRPTYQFRHVLLREAAYGRQVTQRRVRLHAKTATALMRRLELGGFVLPEAVATHLTEANQPADAVSWWHKAGDAAAAIAAHIEAEAHYHKALVLLEHLPAGPGRDVEEFALQLAIGVSRSSTEGYASEEALVAFEAADQLGSRLPDSPAILPAVWGLWSFHVVRGDHVRSNALADRCMRLVIDNACEKLRPAASAVVGFQRFFVGDFLTAREELDIAANDTGGPISDVPQDPRVASRAHLAVTLWFLGVGRQADDEANRAIAAADGLVGRQAEFTRAFVLSYASWGAQLKGDFATAERLATRAIAIAEEHNFATWKAAGYIHLLVARCGLGQHDTASPSLERAIEEWRKFGGAELMMSYFLGTLAASKLEQGQATEALYILDEALTISTNNGEQFYDAELHRLRAITRRSLRHDPRSLFNEFVLASNIAAEQKATSLELRALTDVCRLDGEIDGDVAYRQRLQRLLSHVEPGSTLAEVRQAQEVLATISH